MCCRVLRSFADLVGTELPRGSYRDRHGPPQVVDRDLRVASANKRYRPAPSAAFARRTAATCAQGSTNARAGPAVADGPAAQADLRSRRGVCRQQHGAEALPMPRHRAYRGQPRRKSEQIDLERRKPTWNSDRTSRSASNGQTQALGPL